MGQRYPKVKKNTGRKRRDRMRDDDGTGAGSRVVMGEERRRGEGK